MMGDYLDFYPDYKVTREQEKQEFLDIIQFKKENPERVTLLMGNHLDHYCGISEDLARFSYDDALDYYNIINENKDLFKIVHRVDNVIYSHAGITTGWLRFNNIIEDPNTIESDINKFKVFNDSFVSDPGWSLGYAKNPLGQISRGRGGSYWDGSCEWASLEEMWDNSAFKDSLIQIFAHTRLKETGSFIHKDNFYMCDSRSVFIWDGSELKVYE